MNIWTAAADNDVAAVKKFIASEQFGPNSKDANGYTPLHAAAEYSHLDLLSDLVELGGDVNVRDNDGDTPLHACETVEAAKWLISYGADLKATNNDGLNPLQKAEEDADFPDLISFLRNEYGIEGVAGDELPDNVRLTLEPAGKEDAQPLGISEEQRAKLSEIIENGSDADFEAFLKTALASGSQQQDGTGSSREGSDETPSLRRRKLTD